MVAIPVAVIAEIFKAKTFMSLHLIWSLLIHPKKKNHCSPDTFSLHFCSSCSLEEVLDYFLSA